MCRLGSYSVAFAAGILTTLTINMLVLPSVTGLAVEAPPMQERNAVNQAVDRRHKTDRLVPSNETTHDIAPPHLAPATLHPILVVAIHRSVQCQCWRGWGIQTELQQTNDQFEQKAQQLAERNVEVERKNQEIDQARLVRCCFN